MIPILIADTFGDRNHVTERWADVLGQDAWQGIHYTRSSGAPTTAPHHHGWWCYSQMWPTLYRRNPSDRHFQIHLYRFIDDPRDEAANELLDFAKRLHAEHGCLVWSNSWGGPARGSGLDGAWDSVWRPWCDAVKDFAATSPSAVICMSAGNDGPKYGGSPVWQFGNDVWPIGASDREGFPARFTSPHKGLFTCAGGRSVFGAHPDKVGYLFWDGTSASCPRVAALAARIMSNQVTTREGVRSLLLQAATRPPGRSFDPVWGNGSNEPLYQSSAREQWSWMQAPGAIRQAMARANIFRPVTKLPQPKGGPR